MKQKKIVKPLIEISGGEPVKRTFHIDEEAAALLADYTRFLASHFGKRTVTEDSVVEQLIGKLRSDKLFTVWAAKNPSAVAER